MTEKELLKAYHNQKFLDGPDARMIRMMAEYLEPSARLRRQQVKDAVVFFGSARSVPLVEAKKEWDAIQKRTRKRKLTEQDKKDRDRARRALRMGEYYDTVRALARKVTEWTKSLPGNKKRFVVCTGGGPGMMEAANWGAADAGGVSIGLNISLPFEQEPNPHITDLLSFEFHYFFMRKFWFMYLARAMVIMPGGYGTLDEMMEVLTMVQTRKLKKRLPVVLIGSQYWNEVVDFDALVQWGTISPEDLDLFRLTDDADDAFEYLKAELTRNYL